MSLATFTIIAAIDSEHGLSCNGELPWDASSDIRFFKEITCKRKSHQNPKNVVIMGRKTYQSIPANRRPLADRVNIILSKSMEPQNNNNYIVYNTVADVLRDPACLNACSKGSTVFVIGGGEIYKAFLDNFEYLCDRIILTKFIGDYNCDIFFPKLPRTYKEELVSATSLFNRFVYYPNKDSKNRGYHQEYAYLDLMEKIYKTGYNIEKERTETGTRNLFGQHLTFDISKRFPLITTKYVNFDHIIKEMLWLINGNTDTKLLEEQGIHYWAANSSRKFLDERGLKHLQEGDIGSSYGAQLRRWGAKYIGADGTETNGQLVDYSSFEHKGIDQFENLIKGLREDPFSRRHIISYWNVSDIDKMALPPCVTLLQYHVDSSNGLHCTVYQRSFDSFLGGAYNIAMYAFLQYLIGHLVFLEPKTITFSIGNAHIYTTHFDAVEKQMKRTPYPFPTLQIVNADNIVKVADFTSDNFKLENYESWPAIRAKMAV